MAALKYEVAFFVFGNSFFNLYNPFIFARFLK
jgi:hypothetical protein